MYLSSVLLNVKSRAVQRDLADPYQMHRTVLSTLPVCEGDARAHFGVLHRADSYRGSQHIQLLVQSKVAPDWNRLAKKNYVESESAASIQSVLSLYKSIPVGQVLAFRLRANPTKKVDTKTGPDGQRRNGRRVLLQGETAQIEWLQRKSRQCGFRLLDVTVQPEGVKHLTKFSPVANGPVRSSTGDAAIGTVLYEGYLRLMVASDFLDCLVQGIGPGKAFGCGLLSIAPGFPR